MHQSHTGSSLAHWSGNMSDRLAPLYRSLMYGQAIGIATEHNLLDCARFWWYDGSVGENYSTVYVKRRK